ncbi:catalase-related domain-containing protein [Burkholderia sp. 1B3(2022)]
MRTDGNLGAAPSYWPNSKGAWSDRPQLDEPPLELNGAAAHWDHRVDDDHYQQPGDLFRLMDARQRQCLFDTTARQLAGVSADIRQRHIDNCSRADPAYGAGIAAALARLAGERE